MRRINWGRVILGGIVAGIVVNISEYVLNEMVVKKDWEAAMQALGKPAAMGSEAMVIWILWGFLFGIAAVWLYAAIRPRFGPGAGTAVKASVAAWFFAHLLSAIAMWNTGLFPRNLLTIGLIWTLVETLVATVVGAWTYKEA